MSITSYKLAPLALLTILSSACNGGIFSTTSATTGPLEDGVEYNFGCHNSENWVTGRFPCDVSVNGYCLYSGPDDGYHIPYVNACAVINDTENWEADDANIRAACSETCKSISIDGSHCDDENWFDIAPAGAYNKLQACSQGAQAPNNLNDFAAILEEHGADAVGELACELNSTCKDLFSDDIAYALSVPVGSRLSAAAADIHAIVSPFSEVGIDGQTHRVSGSAAYSVPACTDRSCPIYLGALDLSVEPNTQLQEFTGSDHITGGRIQLENPALGIWLPRDGSVIFPAYSLRFVGAGSQGDDTQVLDELSNLDFVNHDPVLAKLDGDVLSIEYRSETAPQTTLSVTFEP